jgi:ribosomal-protein-alanine N-acetyltransferase
MTLPRIIEGERILLVQMPIKFIKATCSASDAATDDFLVHPDWLQEKELAQLRYEQMQNDPEIGPWLLRAVVDKIDNQMIGHFNCHDRPNSVFLQRYHSQAVEFGYTIYKPYRRQGYAKEVVLTMMQYLQKFKLAKAVVLSAATTNMASLQMIKGLGFKEIDTVRDGVDTEKIFLQKLT